MPVEPDSEFLEQVRDAPLAELLRILDELDPPDSKTADSPSWAAWGVLLGRLLDELAVDADALGEHGLDTARIMVAWLEHGAGPGLEKSTATVGLVEKLARICRDGAERSRRWVVNGVIEHAFVAGVAPLFEGWRDDDELRAAWQEADAWARGIQRVASAAKARLEAAGAESVSIDTSSAPLGLTVLSWWDAGARIELEVGGPFADDGAEPGSDASASLEDLVTRVLDRENWRAGPLPGMWSVDLDSDPGTGEDGRGS